MSTELMPQGYFERLKSDMVEMGFAFISNVAIDSTEVRYHIPTKLARATSLFFHVRGKSFMIMLRYYEQIRESASQRNGYWTATVYIRFKPYRQLLDEHPEWLGQSMEESLYHDMPVLGSTELKLAGFRHHTGLSIHRSTENEQVALCFEEEGRQREGAIASRVLAWRVRYMFEMVEQYLDRGPFYHISLLDFLPHYTFSRDYDLDRLEKIFWPRFDWHYFRHLVTRPYGYNFHKKLEVVS